MKYFIQDLKNIKLKIKFWKKRLFNLDEIKPDWNKKPKNYKLIFEDNFKELNKNIWRIHPKWGHITQEILSKKILHQDHYGVLKKQQ